MKKEIRSLEEVVAYLKEDLRDQEREIFDMSDYDINRVVRDFDSEEDDISEEQEQENIKRNLIYYRDFNNVDYITVDEGNIVITYNNDAEIEWDDDNNDFNITRIEGYMIYINNLLEKITI